MTIITSASNASLKTLNDNQRHHDLSYGCIVRPIVIIIHHWLTSLRSARFILINSNNNPNPTLYTPPTTQTPTKTTAAATYTHTPPPTQTVVVAAAAGGVWVGGGV
eukprot:scaffold3172_cov129-Skeletonema_dohrnii-CCMP3373.AAC.1